MGGSGTTNNNKFNKRSMEYNESDFCSLWTQHIRIRNCADLFINEKLAGDYFFNRLNNVACPDIEAVIEKTIRIFSKRVLNSYVYISDNDRDLENILLKRGFSLIDTMQVLKSDLTNFENDEYNIQVTKIDLHSLPVWIDVFCKSFDARDWKSEVEKVVKLHFKELTLLVSYINDNYRKIPSGCVALFNRYNLMGLYCLGTLSSFRGQGIAKRMIKISLRVARQENLGFLFLQTFSKEGLIQFYKNLGFQIAYKKKIYALYNNAP
jgi:GNAT superfamily N-acetyltransferase